MSAHAELGPSGASIWMNCPGSVAAQRGLPNDTSEFAAEGTFAHLISDECLELGMSPYDFIGHSLTVDGFKFTWSEADADDLALGIEQIRSFDGRFYGEHKVDLSHWLGAGQFGTLDRAVISDDLCVLGDLKWGRGVPVSPVENKQLRIYALGFWWNVARHISKATDILIIIDQPRCSGGGGEWRTTLDELLAFGDEIRAAAERTRDPNAPLAAGSHCLWCRRRTAPGGCITHEEYMLDLIGTKFEDIDDEIAVCAPPHLPIGGWTPERRAHIVNHKAAIEKWLDRLRELHLDDCLRGLPGGGLKAVEGRKSPDKWFDAERADAALEPLLGDARLTKKVRTPKQISEALDLADHPEIKDLIERGSKKPVLVSEADARPAIIPIEQQFDEVEDENG